MSDRVWHKGPPPFPGWWNASCVRLETIWRWWDGVRWSIQAHCHVSREFAAISANNIDDGPLVDDIEWTDYWPENARVPRLDPTGGHWTFNVDGVEPESLPERIDIATRGCGLLLNRPSSFWDWEILEDPTDPSREGDVLAWRPAA